MHLFMHMPYLRHGHEIHMNISDIYVCKYMSHSTCAYHDICVEVRRVTSYFDTGFFWFQPLPHTVQHSWPLNFCMSPLFLPHGATGVLGLQTHSTNIPSLADMVSLDPN